MIKFYDLKLESENNLIKKKNINNLTFLVKENSTQELSTIKTSINKFLSESSNPVIFLKKIKNFLKE
jgi:hypothetical protein